MSAQAQMQLLGEINGTKWYWAAPGQFTTPGVYYWDGKNNVHVAAPATEQAKAEPTDEKQVDMYARKIAAAEALTSGLSPLDAVKNAAAQASPAKPYPSEHDGYTCKQIAQAFTDLVEKHNSLPAKPDLSGLTGAALNKTIDDQMAIVDAMRHQRLERRLQNVPVENERRNGSDRRTRVEPSDTIKD